MSKYLSWLLVWLSNQNIQLRKRDVVFVYSSNILLVNLKSHLQFQNQSLSSKNPRPGIKNILTAYNIFLSETNCLQQFCLYHLYDRKGKAL